MKTTIENIGKRSYHAPFVECIRLDNEISLVLASSEPEWGPGVGMLGPEFLSNATIRRFDIV
ncbi:MAG: hypothetical protein NTY32_02325 [Bacteroidia bacterium]|nr:hypothetical protein [Bacteroidia bacterium]